MRDSLGAGWLAHAALHWRIAQVCLLFCLYTFFDLPSSALDYYSNEPDMVNAVQTEISTRLTGLCDVGRRLHYKTLFKLSRLTFHNCTSCDTRHTVMLRMPSNEGLVRTCVRSRELRYLLNYYLLSYR